MNRQLSSDKDTLFQHSKTLVVYTEKLRKVDRKQSKDYFWELFDKHL